MASFIFNKGHFREALSFAKSVPPSHPMRKSFRSSLNTLNRIKRNYADDNPGLRLCLTPDFVKHSFIFHYEKPKPYPHQDETQQIGLWGGFILHGFQETLSVEIDPPSYPHWSIHT